MKIEFIKPPASNGSVKATIHESGKLGFSQGAAKELKITDKTFVKFGINGEDKSDNSLYVVVVEKHEEETFKVSKAGNYYYINAKALFDKLNIDYKKKLIIYDITEIEHEGEKLYKFIRREKDRKKSK